MLLTTSEQRQSERAALLLTRRRYLHLADIQTVTKLLPLRRTMQIPVMLTAVHLPDNEKRQRTRTRSKTRTTLNERDEEDRK